MIRAQPGHGGQTPGWGYGGGLLGGDGVGKGHGGQRSDQPSMRSGYGLADQNAGGWGAGG